MLRNFLLIVINLTYILCKVLFENLIFNFDNYCPFLAFPN